MIQRIIIRRLRYCLTITTANSAVFIDLCVLFLVNVLISDSVHFGLIKLSIFNTLCPKYFNKTEPIVIIYPTYFSHEFPYKLIVYVIN